MAKNHFDLDGKIALVTGGSRGIGEAIAHILAEYGAHVIVSSRKIDGCQGVADAINAAGGRAEALACHVGEMEQITAAVEAIRAKHGRLDILINNAAANPYYGHILETDLGAFQKTVDVNIRGYFYMSVAAGKLMKENGGGVIVNTASVNGLRPAPNQAIYSITKAAVISMTEAFALECAEFGIRVNALLPGLTKTKFAGALFANEEMTASLVNTIAMKRYATPDEMAGTVLYLVSDASSYTTGESIVVDGGMLV